MTAAHLAAQNVQFGRTTDRHADDRVAAPIDKADIASRMSASPPPSVTAAECRQYADEAATVSIPTPGRAWRRHSLARHADYRGSARVASATHANDARNSCCCQLALGAC